jgi:hypothetical protein
MKLQKLSMFGAVAGALMLAAAYAPKADAQVLRPIAYWNFEGESVPPFASVPANGPGGSYPFLQSQNITAVSGSFGGGTGGHFLVASGQGTTTNQLTGDAPTTNSALDTGNQTKNGTSMGVDIFSKDCFQFGVDTTGYGNLSLSFALKGVGSGGYTGMQIFYSTDSGANFTQVSTGTIDGGALGTSSLQIGQTNNHHSETFFNINNGTGYHTYNFDISGAGQTANAIIEICLSGSTNSANTNHTYFDNIQVTANVPEPSTYIGGLLGIVALCWYQRRWLTRCLRLRRA